MLDKKQLLTMEELEAVTGGTKMFIDRNLLCGQVVEVIDTDDCIHLDDSGDCLGFGE